VKVKLVTRPDMNQTYVEFGHPGISMLDRDMLTTRLMSYILGGGAMSSRMGMAVREEAGLAYDVRCWFDRQTLRGAFHATVQTAKPKDAIRLMLHEIQAMHDSGAIAAEVQKAHNYYTGSFPLTYSSNSGKQNQVTALELYRLGLDWLDAFPDRVRAVTLGDVNKAARDHLRPGDYVMVIMGPVTKDDLGLTGVEWIE
jgi:zinc protease